MTANPRPVSIAILAGVYIAVGIIGFTYHFREIAELQQDSLWIALTEALAIVCGAFMLRGRNWARWLALAWILLHVVVSVFHSMHEFLMHSLICALIAWILLRPTAARYFRSSQTAPT